MIAVAGLHRLRAGEHAGNAIAVRARWPLSELRAARTCSGGRRLGS